MPPIGDDEQPWRCVALQSQLGFCKATRALWEVAVETDCEYVFWLEHDFVFQREVDLRELADVLDDHRSLAQMSLMRQPISPREVEAGGVVKNHERMSDEFYSHISGPLTERREWLSHEAYFTTNPSLMRRQFMADTMWPREDAECEGRFGLQLKEAGYSFGIWGDGSPWVEHIGQRDGHGY